MLKNILQTKVLWLGLLLIALLFGVNSSLAATSLASRLSGYILLQVESLGEAWYVIPKEEKMVYMKDGAVAYQIMREVSLGITNANLAKIPVGIEARFNDVDTDSDGLSDKLEEGLETDPLKADTDNDGFKDGEEIQNNFSPLGPNKLVYDQVLVNRLKGYILLQVEKQGQAWYVNPKDGKRYYMQDGPAAYNIMRYLSLGITNANLNSIPKSSRVFNVDTSGNSSNQGNQGNNNNNNNSTSTPPGNNQGGNSGGGGGGGTRPPTPNNDQDNDGYVMTSSGGNDCNDSNPSIHPGATDICGNNVDEDCSGADLQCVVADYDQDNDGYDSIASGGTDCNDSNPSIHPGATEVLGNNIDDNCNAQTDETGTPPVDNQSPTAPTNLNGTTSGTQVVLTWSPATDNVSVYQYDIERQISVITGYQTIASVNATTYTNIDLTPSGSYTYRIKARDLAGNSSGYSNIFTITVNAAADTTRPSVPNNLAASASGTQISLTWIASTDNIAVYQYHLERSTDNSIFSEIATPNVTSYTDSGLLNATTYYYRVRARDAALNYSLTYSNVANATTAVLQDIQAPTTPANLSATVSGTQASLSWSASTDAVGVTGYQVLRSTTNGGPYTQQTTTNTTSYTQTGLTSGTTYYYVVKAYDAAGNVSGNSNQVTAAIATQADQTAPTTPTNLSASVSGTQASLSWTASTDNVGVTGYQILRSTTSGGPYTQQTTANTTSYTQSGLTSGTTYYYVVKAYDAAGLVSANSNQVTVFISNAVSTSNLIQNSWDFSSAAWDGDALGVSPWSPRSNFIFTSGQADPFGTSKAFKIAMSSNNGGWQQRDSTPNLTLNHDNVTASLYVKFGSASNVIFGLKNETSNTEYEQTFIYTNGVPAWSSGLNDGTTVTSVGNGWYRLSMRLNLLSRGIKGHSFKARVTPAGSSGASGVYGYVAAFQLESGTVATTYIETPSGSSDSSAPTTPTNLSATVSGTQASLSWTASTDTVGVAGYQILRSNTNGSGYTQQANSNTTSYNDSGLTAGTYYYVVKAYDAAGNTSNNSNQATVTVVAQIDNTNPTAPSNLTASPSGTQVSLNWTAAYDAVGVSQYLIETSSGGNYSQVGTTNSTSYTVSGLTASTAYSFRVRAQDAAGNISLYSNVATATTGGTPVSSSVSVTGVSGGTLSQGQATTVSGSGFGTKTTASPIIWDNFESGTLNTTLRSKNPVIGPGWSIGGVDNSLSATEDPTYNSASARGGASQKHVLFNFTNPDSPYSKWLQYYQTTQEAYFTFWWRYDKTGTYWSRNIKPWMEYGPVVGTCPEIYSGFGSPPNDAYYRPQTNDCSSNSDFRVPTGSLAGNPQDYDNQIDDINGHWVRFDVYIKHGTPGVANGTFQSWIHNPDAGIMSHNFDGVNVTTRDFNNPWYQYWLLGAYFSYDARDNNGNSVPYPAYSTAQFRGDDIYFDTSQARVELGNTATWSTNTHREIQVASSWSNGSINFNFNQGSFSPGQTVYLYVVDSNGNVNSNGYPVTISGVLGTNINSCNNPDQDTINWMYIPNGTLVRGCGSAIYVIENGQRVYIPSLEVLRRDYPGQRIYNVNETLLSSYPIVYR